LVQNFKGAGCANYIVKPASRKTRFSLGLHRNFQHSEAPDEASLTSEGVSSSHEQPDEQNVVTSDAAASSSEQLD